MTLRTVIVDDEPLARRRLRRLLSTLDGIDLVAEAPDGVRAVAVVAATNPDVLLLDVQMPEVDGFELVARLARPLPNVIFVTAFESFAVQAFEVNAADYLLKPVSRDRLQEAIDRVRIRLAAAATLGDAQLTSHSVGTVGRRPWLERLPVRTAGRIQLVDVSSVDWFEAADNYILIHVGKDTHILRDTLVRIMASLDPARFARIHRSTIVRLDRVIRLDSISSGDYVATLVDGTKRVLSRTYRAAFERAIGRRL